MSKQTPFDPYYKWLGIPPAEQPANFYRLLSLDVFENDPEIIANAIDRQIAFLQLQKNGAHAADADRLLKEVEQARLTLLNVQKRAVYDRQLKQELLKEQTQSPAARKLAGTQTPSTSQTPNVAQAPKQPRTPNAPRTGGPQAGKPQHSGKTKPNAGSSQPAVSQPSAPIPVGAGSSKTRSPRKAAASQPVQKNPDQPILVFSEKNAERKPRAAAASKSPREQADFRARKLRQMLISWSAVFTFLLLFLLTGPSQRAVNRIATKAIQSVQHEPEPILDPTSGFETPTREGSVEPKTPEVSTKSETQEVPIEPDDPTPKTTPDRSRISESPTPSTSENPQSHAAGERMVRTVAGVEYAFRWCPPGTFTMGYSQEDWQREGEHPRPYCEFPHEVTLTKGFWMLETEVTQRMWESLTGENPSAFRKPDRPVNQVKWAQCLDFCQQMTEHLEGFTATLPTEAQWEYAAMAGTDEVRPANVNDVSWNKSNSGGRCHRVRRKAPNAWGLYDMYGNIYEYCLDETAPYPLEAVTDPLPARGEEPGVHVLRGGCWFFLPERSNAKCRSMMDADKAASATGFRFILLENE